MVQMFAILILSIVLIVFFVDNATTHDYFARTELPAIAIWKILIVGMGFGYWSWNFDHTISQRTQMAANKPGYFSLVGGLLFVASIFSALLLHQSIPMNIAFKIIILSIIMYSLANSFSTLADLVKNEIIHYLQPKESQESAEILKKLIVTGLTVFALLIILVMKNVSISDVVYILGFWLNFILISAVLAGLSKFINLNLYAIIFAYLGGVIAPVLFNNYQKFGIFSRKFTDFTIIDNAILAMMIAVVIAGAFSLVSRAFEIPQKLRKQNL